MDCRIRYCVNIIRQTVQKHWTYTPTPTFSTLLIDQANELDEPCSRPYEMETMSKRR